MKKKNILIIMGVIILLVGVLLADNILTVYGYFETLNWKKKHKIEYNYNFIAIGFIRILLCVAVLIMLIVLTIKIQTRERLLLTESEKHNLEEAKYKKKMERREQRILQLNAKIEKIKNTEKDDECYAPPKVCLTFGVHFRVSRPFLLE